MEASSLSFADTDYSADAVECCPGEPHLFAVGTYQVLKAGERAGAPQSAAERGEADEVEEVQERSPEVTRCGRCLLYEVDGEGRNLYVERLLQRIEACARIDPSSRAGRRSSASKDRRFSISSGTCRHAVSCATTLTASQVTASLAEPDDARGSRRERSRPAAWSGQRDGTLTACSSVSEAEQGSSRFAEAALSTSDCRLRGRVDPLPFARLVNPPSSDARVSC